MFRVIYFTANKCCRAKAQLLLPLSSETIRNRKRNSNLLANEALALLHLIILIFHRKILYLHMDIIYLKIYDQNFNENLSKCHQR